MYGTLRFLVDNLVTEDMITMSSILPGWVSTANKVGVGSALFSAIGDYTGLSNTLFFVQIDDVSAGKEVGQATFRYRTDKTPLGAWEATGVLTSSTNILLEDDVFVRFISGTGDDFELNDYWEFRAIAGWSPYRLLDVDRHTGSKSNNTTTLTITIDLGAPQLITAAALYDHNFTDAAVVTLNANTTDSWVSPPYSQTIPITELVPVIEYLSETYQYWQFDIDDPANPDGYILIGGLYLGTYLQTSKINGDWGSTEDFQQNVTTQSNPAGVVQESMYTEQRVYNLTFDTLKNDAYDDLKRVFQAARIPATRQALPIYVHVFSDEPDYFMLARVQTTLPRTFRSFKVNQSSMTLTEEVKTAQKL